MNATFVPLLALWSALALVVIVLAIYRRMISSHEDDFLHVRDDASSVVAEQGAVAHKLEVIDKWGKTLTVITLVIGAALGGYWVYLSWLSNNASSTNLQIIR